MEQLCRPSLNSYSLGSRLRSLSRLALLLIALALSLLLLYLFLAKITDNPLFVFIVIVILTPLRRAMNSHARAGWANFVLKDAAYGRATETGITYRALFRDHVIVWSQIERLEYVAKEGRIKVYLLGKRVPAQFAPGRGQSASDHNSQSVLDVLKPRVESSGGTFVVVT